MFRNLVRLQSPFGNVLSLSKVCPGSQRFRFALRYSTATADRRRFYQDVSISQGEALIEKSDSSREERPLLSLLQTLGMQQSVTEGDFTVSYRGGLYEINLDRRKLKTPGGKLFTVPNEALAVAVATEWDAQRDTLKFYTMHLTTLCNTALDNPTQRNKEQMISAALKFLETDTVCYRVEEPFALVELQKNEWDPVLHWIENRYNVTIGSSSSIMGPEIPETTKDTFRQHLKSYSLWSLTGLEYVITQLKSVVLSLSLIDRHLSVQEAVLLSRLEEEYQIRRWGNVEWAHDYDMYELRARTAAGALFVHLSSESSTVKRKLLQD